MIRQFFHILHVSQIILYISHINEINLIIPLDGIPACTYEPRSGKRRIWHYRLHHTFLLDMRSDIPIGRTYNSERSRTPTCHGYEQRSGSKLRIIWQSGIGTPWPASHRIRLAVVVAIRTPSQRCSCSLSLRVHTNNDPTNYIRIIIRRTTDSHDDPASIPTGYTCDGGELHARDLASPYARSAQPSISPHTHTNYDPAIHSWPELASQQIRRIARSPTAIPIISIGG